METEESRGVKAEWVSGCIWALEGRGGSIREDGVSLERMCPLRQEGMCKYRVKLEEGSWKLKEFTTLGLNFLCDVGDKFVC